MSSKAEGSTSHMRSWICCTYIYCILSTFVCECLKFFLLYGFCNQWRSYRATGLSKCHELDFSSSLYTNDIKEGRTIVGCICLWRVAHHKGRLTLDDIRCCITHFLPWGISCQLVCYHTGSVCDPCYNWNKTQIASKTVLPRLKPFSNHTIIWHWR